MYAAQPALPITRQKNYSRVLLGMSAGHRNTTNLFSSHGRHGAVALDMYRLPHHRRQPSPAAFILAQNVVLARCCRATASR